MSQGTILIIGGGGKTGARVNARLRAARHRYTTGLAFHRNAFRNEFGDQVQFGVVQAEGSCMIRSLASVPIAENMSAYFATCSEVFRA